jgi:hypothetical protein
MRQEKTNLRSLHYSNRHRQYGRTCYMLDIDAIEFNSKCQPILMYDEKHSSIQEIDLTSFSVQCQKNVANKLGIPMVILVTYIMDDNQNLLGAEHNLNSATHWQYYIIPVNISGKPQQMTEKQWVEFLYFHRNEQMPDLPNLSTIWHEVNLPTIIS